MVKLGAQAVAVLVMVLTSTASSAQTHVTRATYDEWMRQVSNAGRWGAADELGTLNLVTPAKRSSAAQSVRDGITVSLAHDMIAGANSNAIQPLQLRFMINPADSVVTWAVDEITLMAHGWAYSHIDGLAHSVYRGRMYNQVSRDELTSAGANRLGIHAMRDGIVTRGVLVDLPRLKGREYLEPGAIITSSDIEAWERQSGVKIEAGDVLLLRTGRTARVAAVGEFRVVEGAAGPHPEIAMWLKQRGVAALGSDVSNEAYPSVVEGVSEPLHHLALAGMGMPLFDNLNLDSLAIEAASRGRVTFLFIATPLRVLGGTGSPINPIAVF